MEGRKWQEREASKEQRRGGVREGGTDRGRS